jgi:glucose/arabinose dehydrogenase
MVREFCRGDSTKATDIRDYRWLSLQRLICVAICLLFSSGFLVAAAATLPTGFVETQIASGLSSPTAMDFAPDGRLFVCLQGGNLRVVKNGALLPTPFLTLTVDSSGERGLLGVAFDPNFATNNFVYVYYTVPGSPAHNRVSRFTANGDVAMAGGEMVLLNLDNLSSATNHNGGAIHFGPDGKLYVAVGENANGANSQTLANLLGKVLRINSDGTIPADNPFFNTAGARKEIWALGLRNPFTFAFQPGTGRLFINDVGQSTWEEIDDGIAGSNYGWPTTEGPTSNPSFRSPLFAYGHGSSSTTGCAIVGGGFYNPSVAQFPASYVGKYFFADLCTGWIRLFDPSNSTAADFASGISSPVDLKVTADGSLYYLSIGSAAVFKVQFSGTAPSVTTQPSNQTVMQGQPATFMVAASGSTPLSYQWQRNQVNISGANVSSYMIAAAAFADNGAKFRCVVSNAFGSATSTEATLTVNAPPPILLTEEGTDSAIAFDSVTMMRDPFPLANVFNFGSDNRTRVMLFGVNLDLRQGENSSAVTARAEDTLLNVYPMTVEFVGPVPNLAGVTEVIVELPDNLPAGRDVLVSVTLHAQTSNKVRIRIK